MNRGSYPHSFYPINNIWKYVDIINSLRNQSPVAFSLRSQYISNKALPLEQQTKFHTHKNVNLF